MAFTVACAQFSPRKAELDHNLDRIAELTIQASGEGAELVVFPETATTGYFLEGGVLESAMTSDVLASRLASRLGGLHEPIDALVGFYLVESGTLYNAAAYLEFTPAGATLKHVYRKFFLPTYGVFDERRYVSRGHEVGVFETRLGTMGTLLCEDAWHSVLPTICALKGASLLLIPSASPGRGVSGPVPDNLDRYRRLLRGISEEHGVFCVNTMLCGFEGGKGLVGGSSIVDPFGTTLVLGNVQEEQLVVADIDLDLVPIARAQSPLLSDLKEAWSDLARAAHGVLD